MNDELGSGSSPQRFRFTIKMLLILVGVICCIIAASQWGYNRAIESGPAAFLDGLDEKGLIEAAEAARTVFVSKLLTPDEKVVSRYAELAGKESSGVNKILERGKFQSGMLPRGSGAYFSFMTKQNDYDASPHIELQQGSFSSGFYGGQFGVVELLPTGAIENVGIKDLPEIFIDSSPQDFHKHERSLPFKPRKAAVGDLYVVRTVEWDEYDIVAVFQVVDKDQYGATIVWKLLQNRPIPRQQR